MAKKNLPSFFVIFLVVVFIALVGGIFFSLSRDFPIKEGVLDQCNVHEFNGNDKINVLFFATEKQTQEYVNVFTSIKPLNRENFNFYFIDSFEPECPLYKDKAILCHNKKLVQVASSCPNDYIVVLDDQPRRIRSSAYLNVMSLNENQEKTVLNHEFGHVFVGLAEEYVPSKLPRNAPNCKLSCDEFSIKDGCFEGCSESNYLRSVDDGIMRSLSSVEYGVFNEKLIKDEMIRIIEKKQQQKKFTGFIIGQKQFGGSRCEDQLYYLVSSRFQNSKLIINEVSKETGCFNEETSGEFEYVLRAVSGEEVRGTFDPENVFVFGDPTDEIDRSFFFSIPFIENAETLTIVEDNRVVVKFDF